MAVDVRATVTCSLGHVVSGSVSDGGAVASGLIRTTGTVVIKGIIRPVVGTPVTISYSKAVGGGIIPRQLLVLGSFADPFRKITTVDLGCKLTYMQDKREAVTTTAFDDPDNTYTQDDAKKVIVPITAQSVAQYCLAKIGLAGATSLTNKFSVEKFDYSPGYVQVLNDLLVAESQCGYVNAAGVFETFALNQGGGAGPGLDASNIIDISKGGSGTGQPPGESVRVNYTTRKPDEEKENDNNGTISNDTEDTKKRNWEKSESKDLPTTVYVSNPYYNNNPFAYAVPENFEYKYIPRTVTTSKYDAWDRLTERKTITYTILAEVAPGYIVHRAGAGATPGKDAPTAGSIEYTLEQLQTIEYEKTAPSTATTKDKPEGYEKIKKETNITYEPYVKLAASTPIYQLAGANNVHFAWQLGSQYKFIASKTETTYDTAYDGEGAQITKTLTNVKTCYGYTQRGQQYATYAFSDRVLWEVVDGVASSNGTAEGVLLKLTELTPQGTSEDITTGRELDLQRRPSPGGTILQKAAKKADLAVAVGSSETQRSVTFDMPYAPDDTYVKQNDGSFKLVASDAAQKAQLFGETQNRLLLGARSGISVQVPPEFLPTAPFSLIVVGALGVAGSFRTSGTTWTFDSNGIVGSTDALFWGGVGG